MSFTQMMDGNTTLKEICVKTDDMALCTYLVSELPPNLFTREEIEGERFLRHLHQYVQNLHFMVSALSRCRIFLQ